MMCWNCLETPLDDVPSLFSLLSTFLDVIYSFAQLAHCPCNLPCLCNWFAAKTDAKNCLKSAIYNRRGAKISRKQLGQLAVEAIDLPQPVDSSTCVEQPGEALEQKMQLSLGWNLSEIAILPRPKSVLSFCSTSSPNYGSWLLHPMRSKSLWHAVASCQYHLYYITTVHLISWGEQWRRCIQIVVKGGKLVHM